MNVDLTNLPVCAACLSRVRARRPCDLWVAFELAFCLPVLCFRGVGPLLFFVEVGLDRFGDLERRSFACPSSRVRGRPRFPVFLSRVLELTHFFFPRRSPAIFVSSGVAPAGAGVRLRSSGFVRDLELSRFSCRYYAFAASVLYSFSLWVNSTVL